MLINRFGVWFKPRAVIGISNLQLFANTRGKYLQFDLCFQNATNLHGIFMANTDEFEDFPSTVRFRSAGGHEDYGVTKGGYGSYVSFEPGVIRIVDRLNKEIKDIFGADEG